jgi:hypothetical protein
MTDAEAAAVLRRLIIDDDHLRFVVRADWAAIERAIEMLEESPFCPQCGYPDKY